MPVRAFDRITIPAPCNADWDSMVGNDQVRFCEHCNLHVNDLSAMTRQAAMRLVARSQGRLCVRYIQRPDGGVLSKSVPEKLYRIGRRASRIAAGAFSATLSISSAVAQTSSDTTSNMRPASTIVRPVPNGADVAQLSGVVTDPNGDLVSGATVTLTNKQTNATFVYVTGDDGRYKFSLLETGSHGLIAEATSFARTESSELDLRANDGQTMNLVLKIPQVLVEVEVNAGPLENLVVQGGAGVREPGDPLIKAAFKDDLNAVVELIPTVTDINASDKFTNTNALAYAVENHNRNMVNVLLSAGASPNSTNSDGRTPLMHLVGGATVDLVRLLISAGANVNAHVDSGETVLMYAASNCSFGVVKELIDAGARIDAKDDHGDTVLMRAAANEDPQIVGFLIKAGLSLDATNEDGESAVLIAAGSGRGGNLRALIAAGAAINLKPRDLNTALVLATRNEDSSIVRILLDAGASANARDGDTTALMLAADNGKPEMVKALIEAGAEIDAVDDDGWTAMMHANEVENVRVLLNAGADMTTKNKDGQTALGMAVKYEQEDIVKLLKSRGAPE